MAKTLSQETIEALMSSKPVKWRILAVAPGTFLVHHPIGEPCYASTDIAGAMNFIASEMTYRRMTAI